MSNLNKNERNIATHFPRWHQDKEAQGASKVLGAVALGFRMVPRMTIYKLRNFHWLLSLAADSRGNKNDVICVLSHIELS